MDRQLVEERILAAMANACKKDMEWGVDNCAFWVSDIVAPIVDCDLVASYRGKFRTFSGCRKTMGKKGLKGIMEGIAIERGWSWVPPARAEVGDVGLAKNFIVVRNKKVPVITLAICRAPGWFVARAEGRGFAGIPHTKITQAWAVK